MGRKEKGGKDWETLFLGVRGGETGGGGRRRELVAELSGEKAGSTEAWGGARQGPEGRLGRQGTRPGLLLQDGGGGCCCFIPVCTSSVFLFKF